MSPLESPSIFVCRHLAPGVFIETLFIIKIWKQAKYPERNCIIFIIDKSFFKNVI